LIEVCQSLPIESGQTAGANGTEPLEPMTDNIQTGFFAAAGFVLIGCITWFFASRRKVFFKVFVRKHDLREAIRSMPRGQAFQRSLRTIALLQMGVGATIGFVSLGIWLFS